MKKGDYWWVCGFDVSKNGKVLRNIRPTKAVGRKKDGVRYIRGKASPVYFQPIGKSGKSLKNRKIEVYVDGTGKELLVYRSRQECESVYDLALENARVKLDGLLKESPLRATITCIDEIIKQRNEKRGIL